MEYMLEQFELLLKKYTRLRDELDRKSVRSQIYGEVYNEIIEDAKIGIARAKSRNESAALPLHDVSNSVCVCQKPRQVAAFEGKFICCNCNKPIAN